jgi:hypothetical protein
MSGDEGVLMGPEFPAWAQCCNRERERQGVLNVHNTSLR